MTTGLKTSNIRVELFTGEALAWCTATVLHPGATGVSACVIPDVVRAVRRAVVAVVGGRLPGTLRVGVKQALVAYANAEVAKSFLCAREKVELADVTAWSCESFAPEPLRGDDGDLIPVRSIMIEACGGRRFRIDLAITGGQPVDEERVITAIASDLEERGASQGPGWAVDHEVTMSWRQRSRNHDQCVQVVAVVEDHMLNPTDHRVDEGADGEMLAGARMETKPPEMTESERDASNAQPRERTSPFTIFSLFITGTSVALAVDVMLSPVAEDSWARVLMTGLLLLVTSVLLARITFSQTERRGTLMLMLLATTTISAVTAWLPEAAGIMLHVAVPIAALFVSAQVSTRSGVEVDADERQITVGIAALLTAISASFYVEFLVGLPPGTPDVVEDSFVLLYGARALLTLAVIAMVIIEAGIRFMETKGPYPYLARPRSSDVPRQGLDISAFAQALRYIARRADIQMRNIRTARRNARARLGEAFSCVAAHLRAEGCWPRQAYLGVAIFTVLVIGTLAPQAADAWRGIVRSQGLAELKLWRDVVTVVVYVAACLTAWLTIASAWLGRSGFYVRAAATGVYIAVPTVLASMLLTAMLIGVLKWLSGDSTMVSPWGLIWLTLVIAVCTISPLVRYARRAQHRNDTEANADGSAQTMAQEEASTA